MGCTLCGRGCNIDRSNSEIGFCGMGADAYVAKAMLHSWEEPCISGEKGSGAVFFSGCSLRCVYCQNWEISHMRKGLPISMSRLREIFFELYEQGAHNINLVNPTHFVPVIAKALSRRPPIPVVYNTHGYDSLDALHMMEGKVDIYLPDLKYAFAMPARRYSGVPDYFDVAKAAITEMVRQVGPCQLDEETGLLKRGVIIRHLLLPGQVENAQRIIDYVAETYPTGVYFSLMRQYIPSGEAASCPEIDRRVTDEEYEQVEQYLFATDLDGFVQEKDSAESTYVPSFDLFGVISPEDEEEFEQIKHDPKEDA